jgi:hypothetical protein
MTPQQVTDLARPFVSMIDTIVSYYQDPEHEKAFREWYLERYGKEVPEGV